MSETSRRTLLAGAGAGVAAGAVVVGLGGEAQAASPTSTRESVVAWIEDPRSGELHVMKGEEQAVVRDHDLVKRILRAAGGK